MAEFTGFLGWDSDTLLLLAVFGGMEGALNFGKGMKEQRNVPECSFVPGGRSGLTTEPSGANRSEAEIAEGNADD